MNYRSHYRIYSLGDLPFHKICKPVPVFGRNRYRTWHLWDSQLGIADTSSWMSFVKSDAVRNIEKETTLWSELSRWLA